jgi:hypothetical protein
MTEFQVRKDNFAEYRVVESDAVEAIVDGQVNLAVERFGFTSNNITYAAVGHKLGYWQFFPPSGDNADGWGVIPVWGFAVVTESKVAGIDVGERIFGYFPPATTLVVQPERISAATFIDSTAHRSQLPVGYNTYRRVEAEPNYNPALDNERMLLWPLLVTSFCLWDALQKNDWYGAKQLVIGSASSKTAIGLAYAIDSDAAAPGAIGLTSQRNLEFVRELGIYKEGIAYDDLSKIDEALPTVIVDMSGNLDVLKHLYSHLGENMKHCVNVGLTHWDKQAGSGGYTFERSEFFFAPSHIQQRLKDWGPDGFAQRTSTFMAETIGKCSDWLNLTTLDGLEGLSDNYSDVCDGRIAPQTGLIVRIQ